MPPAEGREAAAAELARLRACRDALARVPGAACPDPLDLVDDPVPGLRMTFVAGDNLVGVLGRPLPGRRRAELAATIAAALLAYVAEVGEPYHDFKFDNVLHDEATGRLSFIDLGLPQDWRAPPREHSPLEVSLGQLLGSAVFETARPRHGSQPRLRRQLGELARDVVAAVQESAPDVHLDHVAASAADAYRRATFARRSPLRTAWYATGGYALACRIRLLGAVVGPVPAMAWPTRLRSPRRRARGTAVHRRPGRP